MKNIYILGTPRSGKSTLASMIKEEFPKYTLISMEAVRNGFIKALPDLNMDNRNSEARQKVFPEFVIEFANWNKELNKNKYGNIIEGSLINSEIAKNLLDSNDIVIFLGHNDLTNEDIIQNIMKNDRESDYTHDWSYDKIKFHFGDVYQVEQENKKICEEKGFIYKDTSVNREEVFRELIGHLKMLLNK